MIEIKEPSTKQEWDMYYKIRWEILRKPLGLKQGSERDELDQVANHRIVEKQKNILAVGRLHFNSNNTAQIRYMAVIQNSQRNGYGKLLVDEFVKIAKQNNISKIVLYSRDSVIKFYEKLGFSIIARAHKLKSVQHFLMQKNI